METYIVYAFISMFLFAFYLILLKQIKSIDSVSIVLISLTTSSILIFLYWALFHKHNINQFEIPLPIIAGILYAFSILLMVTALRSGNVSIVSSITSLSVVVVVIISYFFLGEKLDATKLIGIFLAIIAILLLTK